MLVKADKVNLASSYTPLTAPRRFITSLMTTISTHFKSTVRISLKILYKTLQQCIHTINKEQEKYLIQKNPQPPPPNFENPDQDT